MSFRDWELHGGLDPHGEEDDPRDLCPSCGDTFDPDETVVILGTGADARRIHQGCAAICSGCSELGEAKAMVRIGATHWVHEDCLAAPQVIEARYRALQADERRDDAGVR